MEKELVVSEEVKTRGLIQNTEQLYRVAETMMQSGLFKGITDAKQAVVKILAGQEYGIGPFAAMKSIFIIQGNATLSAGLMASKVKAHPKYDYRVKQLDNNGCIISFFENANGKSLDLGDSSFGLEDAQQAGLSKKDIWQKYPRNMFFSRAISNGVRFYCPDLFYGLSVYTPEEIDPDWVIDAEVVTSEPIKDSKSKDNGKKPVSKKKLNTPMTIEMAEATETSDGKPYGDLTDKELSGRMKGIADGLNKKGITADQKEAYLYKRDAILTIQEYWKQG